MSNQHDNIYNILGKLDALTPKQAPVEQTSAKTVNESVEARGSVLAGVARVEARLAQQFAEANDWNNLGAEFRTTKPGTREPTHTGEKEYTKTGVRHHASKRYGGERSDDAETTSSTGEKRGRGRPKKSQFEEEQLDELSPDTLNSYADKAKGQRSHAFGRMVAAQQGNQAADPTGEFAKTWDKRATGYNKAVAKGANDLDKSGTRSTWNYDQEIEEDYANEAGHEEMAHLRHLLTMGNDMHEVKNSQATGDIKKVTFETKLLKDSTSLLQDFKKLSGIK
jgi:hypothetical protein